MRTKEARRDTFLAELKALMETHGAELELTDDGKPYGLHSPRILLSFDGEYTKDGEVIAEYGEFELDSLYL
jgi:hypothetical protein